jgi:hypothetical protein
VSGKIKNPPTTIKVIADRGELHVAATAEANQRSPDTNCPMNPPI